MRLLHFAARPLIPLVLSVAALVSACSGMPPSAPAAPAAAASPPASAGPTAPIATRNIPQTQALLQGHHWQLSGSTDAAGQNTLARWTVPGRPALQLSFFEDRLSIKGLCNTLGAGYRLTADGIQIERPVSTLMACSEAGLMALEQRVGAQLAQVRSLALSGDAVNGPLTLTLGLPDGQRWQFNGQPTPATRYGSAGERIFLEVAPRMVPCNHPLMPKAQCLRVREVHYDEQGLRRGAGDWRIQQGRIEGYEHRAGVRNVLRLQRYDLTRLGPLPADGARYAYVLDMVVETERVRANRR